MSRRGTVKRQVGSVIDKMQKASRAVIDAYQEANEIELLDLKGACIEAAPVKTGALWQSIQTTTRRHRDGVSGEIKATVPYAASVHELHPTRSKFIENPTKEALATWDDNVAAYVAKVLK